MFRVLLIDDEPAATQALKRGLTAFEEIEVVGCYHDPHRGIEAIFQKRPDIVFLDIEMPELDGFEVAKKTEHIPYHLVYVTAYPQHALTSFETKVVDYLLKPVRETRLERCLKKIKKLPPRAANKKIEGITIYDGKTTYRLTSQDISYVENIGRYQQINLTELAQEKFQIQTVITQDTMTNFEAALDSTQFVRVHRSYIINLQLLIRVHREARNTFVYLMGVDKTIPIARSKLALLLEYLN